MDLNAVRYCKSAIYNLHNGSIRLSSVTHVPVNFLYRLSVGRKATPKTIIANVKMTLYSKIKYLELLWNISSKNVITKYFTKCTIFGIILLFKAECSGRAIDESLFDKNFRQIIRLQLRQAYKYISTNKHSFSL